MSSPTDAIAGAQFRSDLQGTNRVLQAEWIALYNEAVDSAWNMCAAARPDFQVASPFDVSVASGVSASFQVPANFHSVIDVVFAPNTPQEYSLGPYNWQNRRSPGGYYWPTFVGYGSGPGATGARLMGWDVFLEPSLKAGGTYRLWFCPRPHLVVQTVRLATVAALPACVAAGAGPGKTLTASVNGALSVDGQTVVLNDKILVKTQAASADDGVYAVTVAGDAGTKFVLTRVPGYDTTATIAGGMMIGDIVGVGQSDATLPVGTQEGKFFTLTTFTTIEAAQAWTEGAAVDPILERFIEILKLRMAVTAMKRDNRAAGAKTFVGELEGEDGKGGLLAQMKSYFATTRSPGPQRMVDCDAQLFRGGGGWGF